MLSLFDAERQQAQLLPAAPPPFETSRPGTELQTLRKRQSFNFGDNRLGSAMLTERLQTDVVLPMQPSAASAASGGTASATAPATAAGLSAAGRESAAASANDVAKPVKQQSLKPSTSSWGGSMSQQSVHNATAAKVKAAYQTHGTAAGSNKASVAAASSRPNRSSSRPEGVRTTARTDSATDSAEPRKSDISRAAGRGPQHLALPLPEWQH